MHKSWERPTLANVRSDTWLEIFVQLFDRMYTHVKIKFNGGFDYENNNVKRNLFEKQANKLLNSVLELIAKWTIVQIKKRDVRACVSHDILERMRVKRYCSKNVQVCVLQNSMSKWVKEFEPDSGFLDNRNPVSSTRVRIFRIDDVRCCYLITEIERFNKPVGGEHSMKYQLSMNLSPT